MSDREQKLDEVATKPTVDTDGHMSEISEENLSRKTVYGIPPKEWSVARLRELVNIVSGNSLPNDYQDNNPGAHPVYKVSDMNEAGNEKYLSTAANWLSKSDLEDLNHTLYPANTVVLPKVGAALLTNKRRILTQPSTFDNNVMGWVPEDINPEFLYYVSSMIDMEAVAQKGAVPSISKSIAASLKVPSPPLEEQRKIATVLFTIDELIQNIDRIILRGERIKKGLIHDIFFRNHEADREVRLNFTKAKIPEQWQIVQLGEIAEVKGRIGWRGYTKEDLREEGPLVIGANEINDRQKLEMGDTTHLSVEKYQESPEIMVEKGHIVLVQRGSLGKVALVESDLGECTINPSMILLKNIDMSERFLYYFLCTDYIQGLIETHSSQTGVPMISQSAVEKFKILCPPNEEQTQISDILYSFDNKIETDVDYRNQLKRLKKGLMQDLLSGDVRTHDKEIEILDEVLAHG